MLIKKKDIYEILRRNPYYDSYLLDDPLFTWLKEIKLCRL